MVFILLNAKADKGDDRTFLCSDAAENRCEVGLQLHPVVVVVAEHKHIVDVEKDVDRAMLGKAYFEAVAEVGENRSQMYKPELGCFSKTIDSTLDLEGDRVVGAKALGEVRVRLEYIGHKCIE